jgi:hypothetical protein
MILLVEFPESSGRRIRSFLLLISFHCCSPCTYIILRINNMPCAKAGCGVFRGIEARILVTATIVIVEQRTGDQKCVRHQAAFIPCKLPRASQVLGMRALIFHTSYEKFVRFNFGASCNLHYSTCIKPLRSHPRHLTRGSKLASCKLRFKAGNKNDRWKLSDSCSPVMSYPGMGTFLGQ